MTLARTVHVEGRVQGVGFRWAAMSEAQRIGVTGWVQNHPEGGVDAFLQGDAARVEAMLGWFRQGPLGAEVECVFVEEVAIDPGSHGFVIRG